MRRSFDLCLRLNMFFLCHPSWFCPLEHFPTFTEKVSASCVPSTLKSYLGPILFVIKPGLQSLGRSPFLEFLYKFSFENCQNKPNKILIHILSFDY